MTYEEICAAVKRLRAVVGRAWNADDAETRQIWLGELHRRFGTVALPRFESVVSWLIDNSTSRSLPQVAQFNEALRATATSDTTEIHARQDREPSIPQQLEQVNRMSPAGARWVLQEINAMEWKTYKWPEEVMKALLERAAQDVPLDPPQPRLENLKTSLPWKIS